jgi:CheY-like chemotaxis protein
MDETCILVIDDEPSILELMAAILEDEGYVVEKATNGVEGLQRLRAARPDLVVLDMWMPGLDGWGFARVLHRKQIGVPVLVITAAQRARRWAEEVNADGFVGKPFELNELRGAVRRLVG